MEKIWYIFKDQNQEGPYSLEELRKLGIVSPDTYVWKEGFPAWILAKDVKELQVLLEDQEKQEQEQGQLQPEAQQGEEEGFPEDELVLRLRRDPPFFFIGLILIILILLYTFFQMLRD